MLSFGGAILGVQGLTVAFGSLKNSIISTNAQLEKSTLQFETLFRDFGEAEKQVKGLFETAARTPFKVGPLIEASRLLTLFIPQAGRTEKMLTLVGDAAAAAGQDVSSVAMWFGRAYNAMKNDRPVGRAMMRLMQMGIVTAEARNQIEQLTKVQGGGEKSLAVLTNEFERFAGSMERMSKTWDGLTSTMQDNIALISAEGFEPLFLAAKGSIGAVIDLLRENRDELVQWGNDASSSILEFAEVAALGTAMTLDTLEPVISGIKRTVGTIWDAYTKLPAWAKPLGILGAVMLGPKGLAILAAVGGASSAIGKLVGEMESEVAKPTQRMKTLGEGSRRFFVPRLPGQSPANPPPAIALPEPQSLTERVQRILDRIRAKVAEPRPAGPAPGATTPPGLDDFIGKTKQSVKLQEAHVKALEDLRTVAGKIYENTRTPQEEYNARIAQANELLRRGLLDQDTYAREVNKAAEALENAQKKIVSLQDKMDELKQAMKGWGREVEDVFVQAFKTGKFSFSALADSVISDLIRMGVQKSITGKGGLLGSLFGFKTGGIIKHGLTAFAHGGIVNTPRLFPMANGATGVVGEAGAEAVVPLPDGRSIPVSMQGGQAAPITYNIFAWDSESLASFVRRNAGVFNNTTQAGISANKPIRQSIRGAR